MVWMQGTEPEDEGVYITYMTEVRMVNVTQQTDHYHKLYALAV